MSKQKRIIDSFARNDQPLSIRKLFTRIARADIQRYQFAVVDFRKGKKRSQICQHSGVLFPSKQDSNEASIPDMKHSEKSANRRKQRKTSEPFQFRGFLIWQRVKDSNPHIQSQSLLCYLYTNPLCPVEQILLYRNAAFCQGLFLKSFIFFPRGNLRGDCGAAKPGIFAGDMPTAGSGQLLVRGKA